MIRVPTDQLKEMVGNEYRLVILAAKRAKQLSKGGRPMVDSVSSKETIIALQEIAEGKITCRQGQVPESSEPSPEDKKK